MLTFYPCLKAIALATILVAAAYAEEPVLVPENIVVSLTAAAPEFLIGENALVHFQVATRSATAIFNFGGDYRGCPRALRFKVTALGPDGKAVADPYPNADAFCMGGLGGNVTVSDVNPWIASVSLPRYLMIDRPGDYVVTIKHDGGWTATPQRPIPAAVVTVRFRLPKPEEIKTRMTLWLTETWYGGTYGKASPPHPDWAVIRHPIWLEALTTAAHQGHRQAIAGIDSIRTVEATGVLSSLLHVGFADQKGRTYYPPTAQAEILQALANRVAPLVWPPGQPAATAPVLHSPEQAVLLRKEVQDLVTSDDQAGRAVGVRILGALGGPGDLPILLAALEKAAIADQDGAYLDVYATLAAYARIAGDAAPPEPTTVATTLVWLDVLKRRPRPLIPRDQARLAACFNHALPTVREAAIEAVAKPWPKAWVPELRGLLQDKNPRVRWYACTRTGETAAKELIPDLIPLLSDQRCDTFAGTAIETLGGRLAAIRAWLDAGDSGWHGIWYLVTATSPCGSFPERSDNLQIHLNRLRAFVEAHAAELEKGPLRPDQTWPTDLLPETMWLQLPQGNWPHGRGPKPRR